MNESFEIRGNELGELVFIRYHEFDSDLHKDRNETAMYVSIDTITYSVNNWLGQDGVRELIEAVSKQYPYKFQIPQGDVFRAIFFALKDAYIKRYNSI